MVANDVKKSPSRLLISLLSSKQTAASRIVNCSSRIRQIYDMNEEDGGYES